MHSRHLQNCLDYFEHSININYCWWRWWWWWCWWLWCSWWWWWLWWFGNVFTEKRQRNKIRIKKTISKDLGCIKLIPQMWNEETSKWKRYNEFGKKKYGESFQNKFFFLQNWEILIVKSWNISSRKICSELQNLSKSIGISIKMSKVELGGETKA